MTFASTIRFAAPLLLAATLAGCVVPYDDAPYSGGAYSGGAYYGGAYYGGNIYSAPYYSGSHYGGDGYATYPSRRHRTYRRDWQDGDGVLRRRQRAQKQPSLEQRHRRDRAERLREGRRATADRARDRRRRERVFRRDRQVEASVRDRAIDDRAKRAARRDRRAERRIVSQRAGEGAAVERRARRAERQAQERGPVRRRHDGSRGSGETDAAVIWRVERARRQGERKSMTMKRTLAGGAVPEK